MLDVTTILRGLPYFDEKSAVVVRNRAEAVKRQQIVVWVSVAESEQGESLRGTPRFPAVLDTGFSHNFGIRAELLARWAGIQPAFFPRTGHLRVNDVTVPRYDADVWLDRNQPGKRDPLEDDPPFRLALNQGIAIYPAGTPTAPRLPVLGLRALKWTGLHLCIDSDNLRVWLRTRRWFWLFG
jgi:hypothetical protein